MLQIVHPDKVYAESIFQIYHNASHLLMLSYLGQTGVCHSWVPFEITVSNSITFLIVPSDSINNDQSGYIKGWYIGQNVRILGDLFSQNKTNHQVSCFK